MVTDSPESYDAPLSKRLLAKVYGAVQAHRVDELRRRLSGPALYGVNYHSTPAASAENLERHLRWFSEKFESMPPAELGSFLGGTWSTAKPALMLHFDDGFLEHATVAAPLLEKHGMRGWFHVVTDHADRASARGAARERWMSWDQARELDARGHAICSHTCGHRRLNAGLSDAELAHEILGSYDRLAAELGRAPAGFCWPGGERDAYDARALDLIVSRYRYAFSSFTKPIRRGDSPYSLPRCNVEGHWSLDAVRLSLGGLWEWKHRRKATEYQAKVAAACARTVLGAAR